MTTFAQLRKVASLVLTPTLAGEGFALSKTKLTYWRSKGEIYHVVLCDLNRGADRFAVYVNVWILDAVSYYDMRNFPSGLPMYAYRGLTQKGFETIKNFVNPVWPAANEIETRTSLETLRKLFVEFAIPWLDSVTTKAAMLPYVAKQFERQFADLVLAGNSALRSNE